jgi:hypothetical protein
VAGQSTSSAGVSGSSTSGDAVLATSNGTANVFRGSNPSEPLFRDVFTVDKDGNVNAVGNVFIRAAGSPSFALIVNASLNSAQGITSEGSSVGIEGDTGSTGGSSGTAGIEGINNKTSAAIYADGFGGLLFRGSSFSLGKDTFTVDDSGNVHAHSFTADLALSPTTDVVTYAPQQSEPTVEDFGEAQMTNGSAYVRLDTHYANLIARNVGYLVFISPEGDNRGLYVTQKSALGFVVRESQGGRSSITFSYRIVAKPLGDMAQRLPVVLVHKNPKYVPQLPRSMPQRHTYRLM